MNVEAELLASEAARDDALVQALVHLVNDAYAVGEAGLWLEGTTRTSSHEIAGAIRSRWMLAATADAQLVGCACVRPLDTYTADLGLVSAAPDHWGSGIGRTLVQFAEQLMRSREVTTMQLELLLPTNSTHPQKERLRDWYTRLGYRVTRTEPFEQVAAHLAPRLAVPCEFLIFHKPLRTQHDRDASNGHTREGRPTSQPTD
jgi:GNAT superfamily N-acetyltransferase